MSPFDLDSRTEAVVEDERLAVTYETAGAMLDTSPETVRWWARTGRIKVVKIGRLARVPVAELRRLVAGE